MQTSLLRGHSLLATTSTIKVRLRVRQIFQKQKRALLPPRRNKFMTLSRAQHKNAEPECHKLASTHRLPPDMFPRTLSSDVQLKSRDKIRVRVDCPTHPAEDEELKLKLGKKMTKRSTQEKHKKTSSPYFCLQQLQQSWRPLELQSCQHQPNTSSKRPCP